MFLHNDRMAKQRKTKKGFAKVWDFLYRWVGGGFSLKPYDPSAKPESGLNRKVATTVEVDSLLDLRRHVVDPLISRKEKNVELGSMWGKVANKVSTLRLLFRHLVRLFYEY